MNSYDPTILTEDEKKLLGKAMREDKTFFSCNHDFIAEDGYRISHDSEFDEYGDCIDIDIATNNPINIEELKP